MANTAISSSVRRGDVVIVDFSFSTQSAGVRPAIVVQNDRDNGRMQKTIVAQLTTNLRRVGEDTQLLLEPSHADWQTSGLHRPSAVNCSNLATIEQGDIVRTIGSLSSRTMQSVEACLKAALGIP